MDPAQWLADYDKRLAQMAEGAKAASATLRRVGATAHSPRGEVQVCVDASGALEDLALTPAARSLECDELARLILDTVRRAHSAASAQVVEVMTEYVGEGPALDLVRRSMPAAPVAVADDDYFANPPEIVL